QTGVLSAASEAKALTAPLGLHAGHGVESGCSAPTVGNDGFFCDSVVHTILQDKAFGAARAGRGPPAAWKSTPPSTRETRLRPRTRSTTCCRSGATRTTPRATRPARPWS